MTTNEKTATNSGVALLLNPEQIVSSPYQPRTVFTGIEELAKNIEINGLLSRPVVRKSKEDNMYEIVYGERRVRAMTLLAEQGIFAGVLVEVRELDDTQAQSMCLIENAQRENLTAFEEATEYAKMKNEENKTLEEIESITGKSKNYIYRRLTLIDLSPAFVEHLKTGAINLTHADLLCRLSLADQEKAEEWLIIRNTEWNTGGSGLTEYNTAKSTTHLKKWIKNTLLLILDGLDFPLDNEDLVEDRGSCHSCPLNTAYNTTLFNDLGTKKGKCTDSKCYAAKKSSYANQIFTEARIRILEENGELFGKKDIKPVTMSSSKSKVVRGTQSACNWRGLSYEGHILQIGSERFQNCDSKIVAVVVDGDPKYLKKYHIGMEMYVCQNGANGDECKCTANEEDEIRESYQEKRARLRPDYEDKLQAVRDKTKHTIEYYNAQRQLEEEVIENQAKELFKQKVIADSDELGVDDTYKIIKNIIGWGNAYEEIAETLEIQEEIIKSMPKNIEEEKIGHWFAEKVISHLKTLEASRKIKLIRQFLYKEILEYDEQDEIDKCLMEISTPEQITERKKVLAKIRKNIRRKDAKKIKELGTLSNVEHEARVLEAFINPASSFSYLQRLLENEQWIEEEIKALFESRKADLTIIQAANLVSNGDLSWKDEEEAMTVILIQFPLKLAEFKKAGVPKGKPTFHRLYDYKKSEYSRYRLMRRITLEAVKANYKGYEEELRQLIELMDLDTYFVSNPSDWSFDRMCEAVVERVGEDEDDEDDDL